MAAEIETKSTAVTIKIIYGLMIVFLIITIISQIVIRFYNPVKTEVAESYTTSSYIAFDGVYVRQEQLVRYDGTGVISYMHDNGEKLAKSSVIAKIYRNNSDLQIQQQIEQLTEQISILQDAESFVGADNSQLEAFSNQIYEKHSNAISFIENGDYAGAADLKSDYLNLFSKKQIVKGVEDSYANKITELNAQIESLQRRITSEPQNLTIQDTIGETGFFVSTADGYENILSYDSMTSLSEEQINEIIKNPTRNVDSNVIGKVIDNYKWKLIGIINTEKIQSVFTGKSVTLMVGSAARMIKATIESIEKLDSGNSIVIFSCDNLSADFVSGRTAQFKLMQQNYSGIRISSSAVRFDENEQMGVYVKTGVEITFKYVDKIIDEGDYIIVRDTTDESGYLSMYDNVVVEGKDIYDGKIVS